MSEKKTGLNDVVKSLAEKLKAGITVDSETGAGVAIENLYIDNLAEGLTPEIVKQVSEHNTNFVAAGAHAFGELSVEAMAKNKKLESTQLDIPMGADKRDVVSYNVARERAHVNPKAPLEKIMKQGDISIKLQTRAGGKGGQLKIARNAIAELALAKLK